MLLQADRSLRHRPREEDPWDGGTLPERRQRREAVLVECRQSERTEVTEWRGETRCGDDGVGVEDKFARPGGARSEDPVAGAGALDAICGGVQGDDPTPQHMVLIWKQVPRPHTGRGPALNRQQRGARGEQDDLTGPRQQRIGYLESRVALTQDHHALIRVRTRRPRPDVVRYQLETRHVRLPRLRHTNSDDESSAGVVPVAGNQCESIAGLSRRLPPAAVPGRQSRAAYKGGEPACHFHT